MDLALLAPFAPEAAKYLMERGVKKSDDQIVVLLAVLISEQKNQGETLTDVSVKLERTAEGVRRNGDALRLLIERDGHRP